MGREVTKKIFKSMMLVCAVVLAAGLALVLGILYRNFDRQMRDELVKEAAYLEYGVEQQGADYLENIKDKSARITYIAQDGTVLFDNEADVSEMENHRDRDEFQKAEKYGAGESSRYSFRKNNLLRSAPERRYGSQGFGNAGFGVCSGGEPGAAVVLDSAYYACSFRNYCVCDIKEDRETGE